MTVSPLRWQSLLYLFTPKRLWLLLTLLLLTSLTGCGFHLRGSEQSVLDTGPLYVDADANLSVAMLLDAELKQSGFTLTNDRAQAQTLLRLTGESIDQRVLSVRSNGRISEFELLHSIGMQLVRIPENPDAVVDFPPVSRVEIRRDYTYNENQVLAKENEARVLRDEMRRQLVRQLVLRTLAFLNLR